VAEPGVALLGAVMSSVRAHFAQRAPTGDAAPFLAMVSIGGSVWCDACLFLGGDTGATAAPRGAAAVVAVAPVRVGPDEPSVISFQSGSDRNRCVLSSSSSQIRSESDRKHPLVVVVLFRSGPDRTIVVVTAVRSGSDRFCAKTPLAKMVGNPIRLHFLPKRPTGFCVEPIRTGSDCGLPRDPIRFGSDPTLLLL